MSTEILISSFSVVVTLVNSIAVAVMYIKYINAFRGVFCMLRSTANGEIEILDSITELTEKT